jgi:glyoxylase-like metal-dependent hydrolase (beta-lactamase superfamily II)
VTGPYEIYAIRYAKLHSRRSELYYRHSSYGEPDAELEMAYYFWVLRRGAETILVDTGFDPLVGAARGRTCLVPPVDALSRLGLDLTAVSTIVVTHFHYDHIGNLDAFPDARLIVPEAELEFWTSPLATRFQFGSHVEPREIALVEDAHVEGRVRTTSGTEEILDGITAIEVGGHSAGQQLTVVEAIAGRVVLASDAVHFAEELERQRPFAVMHDLERMYAAYDTLDELAATGAIIVPGHDPGVAHDYPTVEGDPDGVVVRVA